MAKSKIPQQCVICCGEATVFRKAPNTCSVTHTDEEQACQECWEAHLSYQVEQRNPHEVECMFCKSVIRDRAEMKRLARTGTIVRYDMKLTANTRRFCQDRCHESVQHGLQRHDRATNGRVFACNFCGFRTCVDCDRPDHIDQTCEKYRADVVNAPKHAEDEAATRAAFRTCPSCDSVFEKGKGCGYTECTACGFRFCGRCFIPWVGDNSAYLGGKEAHANTCLYRTRDEESKHSLKRRFQPDEETEQRLEEKETVKRQKRELKKLKKLN